MGTDLNSQRAKIQVIFNASNDWVMLKIVIFESVHAMRVHLGGAEAQFYILWRG